jgi:hypothetical protein
MENALGLNKTLGDVLGVAMFAVLLGIGRILYAKFGKNTRRGKILIGVAIYFILYAILRTVGSFLDVINFRFLDDIMDLWIPMGIFTVIGAGLYAATCILYEKKVNI